MVGIFSAVGSVKDQLLATKLLRFISQLSEISLEERNEMVDKFNEDDKFSGRAGAAVIEILDRMESQKKPELAAKDEVSSSFYQRFGFIVCHHQPLKLYLPIW